MNTPKYMLCIPLGFLFTCPAMGEEVLGTGYAIHSESAQIIGTGRRVSIHRIPVVKILTGETTYYDFIVTLSVDTEGNIFYEGMSTAVASAPLNFDNFIGGTYVATDGEQYLLNGPAHVGDNRTSWALACIDCRATMSWTTGEVAGHPDIGLRTVAPDLPSGYSYGVMGQVSPYSTDQFGGYRPGNVIGVRQIGGSVTVYLFSSDDTDIPAPATSVTLVKQEQ